MLRLIFAFQRPKEKPVSVVFELLVFFSESNMESIVATFDPILGLMITKIRNLEPQKN